MPQTMTMKRGKKKTLHSAGELPHMPEKDSAGRKADEILDVKEQVDKLKGEIRALQDQENELREQMARILLDTGRDRLKVGDVLFEIKCTAAKETVVMKRDPGTKKKEKKDDQQ